MYYNYTVQKKNKKMGPYIGIFFGSKNFISEQREHVFLNCSDVINKKIKKKIHILFLFKKLFEKYNIHSTYERSDSLFKKNIMKNKKYVPGYVRSIRTFR